jgi:hypothetical protein
MGNKLVVEAVTAELRRLAAYVQMLRVCCEKSCFDNVSLLHPLVCKTKPPSKGTGQGGLAGSGLVMTKSDTCWPESSADRGPYSLKMVDAMNYSVGVYGEVCPILN